MDKKQLLPEESINIGEYLPGTYPHSLLWETEIESVKEERKIEVLPSKSNALDGSLSMYEVDLIDGPYKKWNYLINDKQVDLKKYVVDGLHCEFN